MSRKVLYIPLFLFLSLTGVTGYGATGGGKPSAEEHPEGSLQEEGKFQPGTFIIDHILDSHEWHILSYRDFHLSIPLPVILISRHTGFHIFMSSKFHHGHDSHQGFYLAGEGEHKGRVVEVLEGGEEYLPLDLSITKNVFAVFISIALMLWIFLSVARRYRRRENLPPTGLQNLMETIILFIRDDVARPAIGEPKHEKFVPYLLTLFFFILLNNLLGLIPVFPFGANVTGNIAVTMALALFTFIMTNLNGSRHYWMEIFNAPGVPWFLKLPLPLMPIIEMTGLFIKPFVLMVRLFANISAGHIIALGFYSLIFMFGNMMTGLGYGVSPLTVIFTVFMTILELLVAFIQAYVFTLLSALYCGMATAEHH